VVKSDDREERLVIRPRARSLVLLFVVTWLAGALILVAVLAAAQTTHGGTDRLAGVAFVVFLVAIPLLIWKGSQLRIEREAVMLRAGFGRWHRLARSEVTAVSGRAIEGRSVSLRFKRYWADDQLADFAAVLDVPFTGSTQGPSNG
jgi:hypothetical protein